MSLRSLLIKLGLYKPGTSYEYLPDENHIETINCWTTESKRLWHYKFIVEHFSELITVQNSLLISSVFGRKKLIKQSRSRKKLFYTGENVSRFRRYEDQCRSIVDLVVGFDYIDTDYYQRFPYWIETIILPSANHNMVRDSIANYVKRDICRDEDKSFASLVSSHDDGKVRTILFNSLSKIDKVDSGGKYLNNTSDLKERFKDDKAKFIGHYKFNICPENSNREGYVTEKVFEAIKSNTIPIYWGSNNNPEPDVLNKDSILFYNGPESLPGLNRQIEELYRNPKLYKEFLDQPKFQPNAAEYIIHCLEGYRSKLHKLLTKNI